MKKCSSQTDRSRTTKPRAGAAANATRIPGADEPQDISIEAELDAFVRHLADEASIDFEMALNLTLRAGMKILTGKMIQERVLSLVELMDKLKAESATVVRSNEPDNPPLIT
jgi:hypothetical protein